MNFNYNLNEGMLYHFYQHTHFGLDHTILRGDPAIDKNLLEELGDLGLWTLENFPKKVWKLMKEPRWITLVLTQISLNRNNVSFLS